MNLLPGKLKKGNIKKEQFTKEKRNKTAWALPAESIVVCRTIGKNFIISRKLFC